MAKKSTATRQTNAARRSQTTSKAPEVTLVRQPRSGSEDVSITKTAPSDSATVARPPKTGTAPAVTSKRLPEATRPGAVSAAAKTPENVSRPASRNQVSRVARAQASQRARLASQISPRQYAYVRDDLRLIGILAASMFLFIIILHFVLPI